MWILLLAIFSTYSSASPAAHATSEFYTKEACLAAATLHKENVEKNKSSTMVIASCVYKGEKK